MRRLTNPHYDAERLALDYIPHMLVGGRDWLADVGMGSLSLTAPLEMIPDVAQDTTHDRRRLVRRDSQLAQQVFFDGSWQDVQTFRPETAANIDPEIGNWHSHTHPQAHFRQNLMVARAAPDGRRTLFNRELTIRHRDGSTEKSELRSHYELLDALREHFALQFSAGTRFEASALTWSE